MNDWRAMTDIRREYGGLALNEETVQQCPITQFKRWFEEVLLTEISDPTAMVLSTVDQTGHPDSRVLLLKGLEDDAFIFYTNYQSTKGLQLRQMPYAALNFYWPQMARQVRVRGRIKRVSAAQSDVYFASRPVASQISAIASAQSREIADRKSLEDRVNTLNLKYEQKAIARPRFWGGYMLLPEEMEFWQGRDNRLSDRIYYCKKKGKWTHCRLAP